MINITHIKSLNKDAATEQADIKTLENIAAFMITSKILSMDCGLENYKFATLKYNREASTATEYCIDAAIKVERFGGDETTECKIFVPKA
jgi:hypothetical protein